MAEFYIEECHPLSTRCAILEDNGNSAWLYLTPEGGRGIEKDAFVYSPIDPVEKLDKASIEAGNPPSLTAKYASSIAVIESSNQEGFKLNWSADGDSVAVVHLGKPIAMVVAGHKRGYSTSLKGSSGFGQEWDSSLYESVFK